MQDLTINLQNVPGALGKLGEALGDAGINIEGLAGFTQPETGAHLLVQSAQLVREALADTGIECSNEREVEVISIVDQPGEMGRHLRRIGDAGVNIDLVYLATNTRLVLGSADMEGLKRALHGENQG